MKKMKAKIYDPLTKKIIEIPTAELAPGYIRSKEEGIDGEVFIATDTFQLGSQYRHLPFDTALKKLMRQFSQTFREVFPRTPKQWEEGFRKDMHPDREIECWAKIGDAFNFFTRDVSSLQEKRDILGIILSFFNNGPDAALECVECEALARARAIEILDHLQRGHDSTK